MDFYYSGYRNAQMLVYLMKAHNIRKVVISPGTTHISLVGSLQQDDFFELYSEIDERSACYMACGLAIESGEPVAITCTGATASRNYFPGLSEAYYKKLPILAITGAHDAINDGNLLPQYINRFQQPKDTVRLSVHLQDIKDKDDEWDCNLKINRALLELRRHGGGPVHINLTCNNKYGMQEKELCSTRIINRLCIGDVFPDIHADTKVAITVGAHKLWSKELTDAVERFCATYDAVVFVDHSSGYHGKYRVLPTMVASQEFYDSSIFSIDLLIHIGEQSGDYYTYNRLFQAKEVWRVSEDGEIRDTFRKLTNVFEMKEIDFFQAYASSSDKERDTYLAECKMECDTLYQKIPELPFSNIWLAKEMTPNLPQNAVVHLGVSNTMRSWTFFDMPDSVFTAANIGCRGIDGAISTALGMSLVHPDLIHYCILGDLTFFYNLNVLGNRHFSHNLRILLINNGGGAEFHMYSHPGQQQLKSQVGTYVAGDGHYGHKSRDLIKNFSENLGFQYMSATSKEEVIESMNVFLQPNLTERPLLLEVFTNEEDESEAVWLIRNIKVDTSKAMKANVKGAIKNVLGEKGTDFVKKFVKDREKN